MTADRPSAHWGRWAFGATFFVLSVLGTLFLIMGPLELLPWQAISLYLVLLLVVYLNCIREPGPALHEMSDYVCFAVESEFLLLCIGEPGSLCRVRLNLSKISRAILGDVRRPDEMRLQLHTHWGWVFNVPALEDMEEFVAAVVARIPVEIERQNAPTRIPLSHGLLVGGILLTLCLFGYVFLMIVQS